MAPGMWPSRRVFPSNPRYSAGGPRVEQGHVGAIRAGRGRRPSSGASGSARGASARQGSGSASRVRDRPALRSHAGNPPSRMRTCSSAVGPQASTRTRAANSPWRVVVDDDRRAVADAQPRGHGRHPVRADEPDAHRRSRRVSTRSARQSRWTAPGMWPRAWTVGAAPVRPPARIEDPHARPTELLGQPVGGGQELGSGQAGHRRYHTDRGRPVPARRGPAGGRPGRRCPPSGRHLPEHRARSGRSRPRRRPRWPSSRTTSSPTGRAHVDVLAGDPPADGRGAGRGRRGADRRRRRTSR